MAVEDDLVVVDRRLFPLHHDLEVTQVALAGLRNTDPLRNWRRGGDLGHQTAKRRFGLRPGQALPGRWHPLRAERPLDQPAAGPELRVPRLLPGRVAANEERSGSVGATTSDRP